MLKFLKILKRLGLDKKGMAATEFALVLPVLVVMTTGVAELAFFLMADRRVVAAAQTVSDLISQATDLNAGDLTDIYQGARYIIAPFDENNMTIGAVSVRYDANTGNAFQDWGSNWNGGNVVNAVAQANGLGIAGESVVIVTVTYDYNPLISAIWPVDVVLSETSITRPRTVSFVNLL